jgi:diguanylate cyclase (GGDEF)-like protein/PAS domain S-box-containing protein
MKAARSSELVTQIEHGALASVSLGLLEIAPDAMAVVDRNGRITLANARAELLFGYERGALSGCPVTQLVPLERREAYAQRIADYWRGPATARFDLIAIRKDRICLPIEVSLSPVPSAEGQLVIVTVRDLTDRIRAQQADARLAAIVQSASDAIYTFDLGWQITSWNPAAEKLFGYEAAAVLGRSVDELLTDDEITEEIPHRLRALADQTADPLDTARHRRTGEMVDVSITMSAVHDAHDEVIGISAIARDISERRRTEGKLQYLASHDALTDLYNRPRFEEELEQACARANRERTSGAVLLLDLDNFKQVNDTFGHQAGDQLLRAIATALVRRLRKSDILARLGGDEFAVLVAPSTLKEAAELAADLLSVVRNHAMSENGHPIATTASIGVVEFGVGASSCDLVLADVDRAMYASKGNGRDRATVYSHDQRPRGRAASRISWEHLIRDAFEHDRFELYCQPIIDLRTRRMTQCELLLRMRNGDEVILPNAFLGVAERSGQIHAIDRWVIDRGIQLAAEHPDLRFEINLSGRTADDDELPAYIESVLETYNANPANLVFEVTETAAIGNIGRAQELARALSALGCRFALDDFGAGFSSFYYLKHLPVQYLKIDGDFVTAPRSRTDELVIESIVRIARDLGKHTIAKFVSDEETLDRLEELGVDYGQGIHVGRPFQTRELTGYPAWGGSRIARRTGL